MAASKPHATLEKWIWILIFGGFLMVIFGIATGRADEAFGWSFAVPGALLAVAEYGIGFLDFLKCFFRLFIPLITVWVMFHREFAISFFDFFFGGGT